MLTPLLWLQPENFSSNAKTGKEKMIVNSFIVNSFIVNKLIVHKSYVHKSALPYLATLLPAGKVVAGALAVGITRNGRTGDPTITAFELIILGANTYQWVRWESREVRIIIGLFI